MRIAYILAGLFHSAGIERVLTMRANALCGKFDITIITLDDGSKPDYFQLDSRVKRICLDAENSGNLQEKLTDVLIANKYDIVTSTGGLEFYCLYKIKDGSKKFLEFHFSFDISEVWMGHIKNPIIRWLAIKGQTIRRILIARHYDKIIVLCKADQKKWQRYCNNVECIYNPLTIVHPILSDCSSKNVIAVGRLDYQKGFDFLIDAWDIVYKTHPDWKLNIYGEGTLHESLQDQINTLGLSNVVTLKGRTDDVVSKYAESSIFILSSRDEAFGLVIVEAESCGLPVITFDCPSAPAELVDNGRSGFVINKIGNINLMAERICFLIENESSRKSMGKESLQIAKQFEMKNISKSWIKLYNF